MLVKSFDISMLFCILLCYNSKTKNNLDISLLPNMIIFKVESRRKMLDELSTHGNITQWKN